MGLSLRPACCQPFRPFFDRAGAMSGFLAGWNTNPMPQSQALYDAVVKETRCPAGNISCLAALPAPAVVAAAAAAFKADPSAHWGPAVDGVETVASPYNLTKAGAPRAVRDCYLAGTQQWCAHCGYHTCTADPLGRAAAPRAVTPRHRPGRDVQPRRPVHQRSSRRRRL